MKKTTTLLLMVFLLGVLSGRSVAQETPAEPPADSATQEDDAAPESTDVQNDDGFIPTEKINVDSEVSFPVDI